MFWYKGLMINEETFLFQFDLVCNRDWYVTLTQSMFMLGFMLGVFSSGLIADRYLQIAIENNNKFVKIMEGVNLSKIGCSTP